MDCSPDLISIIEHSVGDIRLIGIDAYSSCFPYSIVLFFDSEVTFWVISFFWIDDFVIVQSFIK